MVDSIYPAHEFKSYVSKYSSLDSEKDYFYKPPESGGGNLPERGANPIIYPNLSPQELADRAGINYHKTKYIEQTSDLTDESNILYVVNGNNSHGGLGWNGQPNVTGVHDVAICGKNNAKARVPHGRRKPTWVFEGSRNMLWSNINIDQRAHNAWGRIYLKFNDNAIIEHVTNLGSGRDNSYNYHTEREEGGPTLYAPARSSSGNNIIRNVSLKHGGIMEYEHFGVDPLGVFCFNEGDAPHKGNLHMTNSIYEDFPGDGLYATNTTGKVFCNHVEWNTCGTVGGRICEGEFNNCIATFDYNNTTLGGTHPTKNGCVGFMVENKVGNSHVTMNNCLTDMINVYKCGGGLIVPNYTKPGHIQSIKNSEFHIRNAKNSGGRDACDVFISGGSSINKIENCTFSGPANERMCLLNDSNNVTNLVGNTFNYKPGRDNTKGPFR